MWTNSRKGISLFLSIHHLVLWKYSINKFSHVHFTNEKTESHYLLLNLIPVRAYNRFWHLQWSIQSLNFWIRICSVANWTVKPTQEVPVTKQYSWSKFCRPLVWEWVVSLLSCHLLQLSSPHRFGLSRVRDLKMLAALKKQWLSTGANSPYWRALSIFPV